MIGLSLGAKATGDWWMKSEFFCFTFFTHDTPDILSRHTSVLILLDPPRLGTHFHQTLTQWGREGVRRHSKRCEFSCQVLLVPWGEKEQSCEWPPRVAPWSKRPGRTQPVTSQGDAHECLRSNANIWIFISKLRGSLTPCSTGVCIDARRKEVSKRSLKIIAWLRTRAPFYATTWIVC